MVLFYLPNLKENKLETVCEGTATVCTTVKVVPGLAEPCTGCAIFPDELKAELEKRARNATQPHVNAYVAAINSALTGLLDSDAELDWKLEYGEILNLDVELIPIADEQVAQQVISTVAERFSDSNWDFSWSIRVKTSTKDDGSVLNTPYLAVKLAAQ